MKNKLYFAIFIMSFLSFFISCKKDNGGEKEDFREKYLGTYNFETIQTRDNSNSDTILYEGEVKLSSLPDTTALVISFIEQETLTVAIGKQGDFQYLETSNNTSYPMEFWGGFSNNSRLSFHMKQNESDSTITYDVTGIKK